VADADHPHNVLILLRAWLQRDEPDDARAALLRLGITDIDSTRDTLLAAVGMLAGLASLHSIDTERHLEAVIDDIELLVMSATDPDLL
jgi:hypothetical protein